jgi:hypothetical protein
VKEAEQYTFTGYFDLIKSKKRHAHVSGQLGVEIQYIPPKVRKIIGRE